jgi:uncharacterized membrane protein
MGHFIKDIAPWKLRLLKICIIGFLIAIVGLILFILDFSGLGRLLIYMGFIIGFLGIGLSFYVLIFKPDSIRWLK